MSKAAYHFAGESIDFLRGIQVGTLLPYIAEIKERPHKSFSQTVRMDVIDTLRPFVESLGMCLTYAPLPSNQDHAVITVYHAPAVPEPTYKPSYKSLN